MKKSELVDKLNDLHSRYDELEGSPINSFGDDLYRIQTKFDSLIDEIEESKIEEDEDEQSNT